MIQLFPSFGPYATNGYVAYCPTTKEAAIIDAPPGSFSVISSYLQQEQLTPKILFLTHSHWDHIADAKLWKEHYPLSIAIHALDLPNLVKPGSDLLPCSIEIPPTKADVFLEEGKEITVGNLHFDIIHTPGHSPGSVCLYEKEHGILFTGDTLFKRSIGNLSFPTSQPKRMKDSLQKLVVLPPSTRIYPGHGPSTTIEKETTWIKGINF